MCKQNQASWPVHRVISSVRAPEQLGYAPIHCWDSKVALVQKCLEEQWEACQTEAP